MNPWTVLLAMVLGALLMGSWERNHHLENENAWLQAQIENMSPIACFAEPLEITHDMAVSHTPSP